MKAKVTRIEVDTKGLLFRIDSTPDPMDSTYAECTTIVPARPLTEEEINDPQLAKLVSTVENIKPVNSTYLRMPLDATQEQIEEAMRKHLIKLNSFLILKAQAQSAFMGIEVT